MVAASQSAEEELKMFYKEIHFYYLTMHPSPQTVFQ